MQVVMDTGTVEDRLTKRKKGRMMAEYIFAFWCGMAACMIGCMIERRIRSIMDKNPVNGKRGWEFLQDRGQKANPAALKSAVYALIGMSAQKTGGEQSNGKKSDLPFESLEMIKFTIICEAAALVLSGRLDELNVSESNTKNYGPHNSTV